MGAWEGLVHDLAQRAGIHVPPARIHRFGNEHHTFCVKRFDRLGGRRRFYASAMAMLRKDESEGTSYLDLAEFLHHRGAGQFVTADLEQLFRRVAFNVAIGNRDDHLNLDETGNRPSLATVIDTAEWYSLSKDDAARIVGEVTRETRQWRRRAQRNGMARADIELMTAAFAPADVTS